MLPTFRICSLQIVKDHASTMLWFDNWLYGKTPKDIWPDLLMNAPSLGLQLNNSPRETASQRVYFEQHPYQTSHPSCSLSHQFWKVGCPSKITLFY
ncbi:hypothetical protein DsansV1_C10g0101501 [Dioscorea sansibarensis]